MTPLDYAEIIFENFRSFYWTKTKQDVIAEIEALIIASHKDLLEDAEREINKAWERSHG